ncbi:hypothetical protein MICAF_1910014 [Microcystis aeruginosa PCC 9807]|uniref:Uncharacterized protein n=1 Tax=Microcystis aeruginosa PCC 9807 TaxID=1160283 RepID=I4H2R6_MICAE|nr:hypothetical protein MICAF_1910014 [Microcystis aeruginosa PCC 9807]
MEARRGIRFSPLYPEERVSIHTLHELEASLEEKIGPDLEKAFPFIRFTNWKQDGS